MDASHHPSRVKIVGAETPVLVYFQQLMKLSFIIGLIMCSSVELLSQMDTTFKATSSGIITLEDCYKWSRDNYPEIKKLDLIHRATEFSVDNASTDNLPQVSIMGQVTYQSDVTGLPIEMPGVDPLSKDQYKIYGEVYQPLTQFGKVSTAKEKLRTQADIHKQQVEVDLYQLRDRINQVFFGALLIDEAIEQLLLTQSTLDSAIVRVNAGIENGTATLMDKNFLEVEKILLSQQIQTKEADKLLYLEMLSLLTGKMISPKEILVKPEILLTSNHEIRRPELRLFDLQKDAISLEVRNVNNDLIPNIGLFAQGGYGRPALNFLSNDFEWYYIVGLRAGWNLTKLYTHKNQKDNLLISSQQVDASKETFLLNTELSSTKQEAEIDKYRVMIDHDKEIITLREEIMNTAEVQLRNGLITTIDYVRFVNDAHLARQNLILHETQLLLAQYKLLTITGSDLKILNDE